MSYRMCVLVLALLGTMTAARPATPRDDQRAFRAGVSVVDVTPEKFPVMVSGGFLERQTQSVHDPLHARALVLDDGQTRVALVIVDSLFLPREMLDQVKQTAAKIAGISPDRMLIAATHTHSAPSLVGALGTGVDAAYAQLLPGRLVRAIQQAAAGLVPVRIGWAVAADPDHTHCRQWIRRPDRMGVDPFGEKTVRVMMHPGYQNPDYLGPAGPVDPELSLLAVQTLDGRPLAVLANYSMHYFGASPVSADYFGVFCEKLAQRIRAPQQGSPPVVILSQGTSGDLHWMDYSQPHKSIVLATYADQVAAVASRAYATIQYHDWVPLAMAERKLTLERRVPDAARLAWARKIAAQLAGRKPQNQPELYALEQIYLHDQPQRELKLQALRVGDLGLAAIPCEVFGITGLKLKGQSPLVPTFNIELANGAEGYIPPPEYHKLGGYTTWAARSAGLEVQAEPKIVENVLEMFEQLVGRSRRPLATPSGPYVEAVLASQPAAYWRMAEIGGTRALDATGHNHHGAYSDGVVFYLEGPEMPGFCGPEHVHRAPHFAGGRMEASLPLPGNAYTVEMWFWNALPNNVRPITGQLFARGSEGSKRTPGDLLSLGGTQAATGNLVFASGRGTILAGTAEIRPKTWNYVALIRDGDKVRVHLDGAREPDISGRVPLPAATASEIFIGGRIDDQATATWEGKIDEVAIYERALTADEIAKHYAAARASH